MQDFYEPENSELSSLIGDLYGAVDKNVIQYIIDFDEVSIQYDFCLN